MKYFASNGELVTQEQIKTAVSEGTARIIYSRMRDGGTGHSVCLDGKDIDTRGQCYSVWDEQWTSRPSLRQAMDSAS